jgi:hypothetical protein
MPLVQVSKGNLNADFNAAVTKIKDTFSRHGFEVYSDTMIDEIAEIIPGDKTAKLQVGMLLDASGYRILVMSSQYSAHSSANSSSLS